MRLTNRKVAPYEASFLEIPVWRWFARSIAQILPCIYKLLQVGGKFIKSVLLAAVLVERIHRLFYRHPRTLFGSFELQSTLSTAPLQRSDFISKLLKFPLNACFMRLVLTLLSRSQFSAEFCRTFLALFDSFLGVSIILLLIALGCLNPSTKFYRRNCLELFLKKFAASPSRLDRPSVSPVRLVRHRLPRRLRHAAGSSR